MDGASVMVAESAAGHANNVAEWSWPHLDALQTQADPLRNCMGIQYYCAPFRRLELIMYVLQVFDDASRVMAWRYAAAVWESTVGYCYVMAGPGGGCPPSEYPQEDAAIRIAKRLAVDSGVRSGVVESHTGSRVFDSKDWPHEPRPVAVDILAVIRSRPSFGEFAA